EENALCKALSKETDINVINTPTNYCEGESESLVGKVLTSSNDKLLPHEHIVRYSPNCFHCIHPEFMRYE
ncbi:hypothetical protein GLOIN_2v1656870, partial [Rhizophagus irregularis DAOM 181602=DAOM 197198]